MKATSFEDKKVAKTAIKYNKTVLSIKVFSQNLEAAKWTKKKFGSSSTMLLETKQNKDDKQNNKQKTTTKNVHHDRI